MMRYRYMADLTEFEDGAVIALGGHRFLRAAPIPPSLSPVLGLASPRNETQSLSVLHLSLRPRPAEHQF